MASEALLLGRVTYEGFAAAWPSRTGEFADKFNGMPKYVVSSPLVLGSGKRLFGDPGEAKALRLVDWKPVGPDGVVILTYRPGAVSKA
jgi:dihydrofolate reductase